jgi:hypothetical protein
MALSSSASASQSHSFGEAFGYNRVFSCSSSYSFAEALRLETFGLRGLWPPADFDYMPP